MRGSFWHQAPGSLEMALGGDMLDETASSLQRLKLQQKADQEALGSSPDEGEGEGEKNPI